MDRPVLTKIAGKFQVTVPVEVREAFGLQEGDLLEWDLPKGASSLNIAPKRAQLITPLVEGHMEQVKQTREKAKEGNEQESESLA